MSAILSTETLNDFIAPSVACIKPVETLPAEPDANPENEVILDGTDKNPAAPAQISLTDCLACSGCVTSAEAVLVSLQSHAEVLSTLDAAPALRLIRRDGEGDTVMGGTEEVVVEGLEDEERKIFVASVSPQTRASLAAACGRGVSERQAGVMLERLLREEIAKGGQHKNAFTWVVDTNTAREASLVLGADEVLSQESLSRKPILASSCPGWVCYAEKTHPYVLPHLSKVKSPQAMLGTMFKTTLSKQLGVPPSRIWHLAVMPCFDKKLEASREELMDTVWQGQEGRGVRDVDCVITSKEVLMLAESRGFDFFSLSPDASTLPPQPLFPDDKIQSFLFPPHQAHRSPREAGTSGGNLRFILQSVASGNPGSQIQSSRGRNVDVMEYTVVSSTGEPLFKAARYYGFRNIQNLVRKLKPAKPTRMPGGKPFGSARRPGAGGKSNTLDFAYVEVMACPGGCTNGGGQIKVDDPIIAERTGLETKPGPQEQKEWLALVDEAYFSSEENDSRSNGANGEDTSTNGGPVAGLVDGISPSYIRDTLAHWSDSTGIDADRLALTTFREVISDVGKDKSQTERAAQLAGKVGGGW